MAVKSGTHLGPYEIVALLGVGGMGEVYRARDARLGREVAIKVLPAAVVADPERRRRFEREARATATLDHPNILAVHDVGTWDRAPYLVEELLKGESLQEQLARGALAAPTPCGSASRSRGGSRRRSTRGGSSTRTSSRATSS